MDAFEDSLLQMSEQNLMQISEHPLMQVSDQPLIHFPDQTISSELNSMIIPNQNIDLNSNQSTISNSNQHTISNPNQHTISNPNQSTISNPNQSELSAANQQLVQSSNQSGTKNLDQAKNQKKGTKSKAPRGQGTEAKKVMVRLQGFDYEKCEAWIKIRQHFSQGITHSELKSVARLLIHKLNLKKLDRDASRDNRVLVKWFQENWNEIGPNIDKIQFTDENENPIVDPE